jgi:hypothetical protein
MPKVDAVVQTPNGPGSVVWVSLLKEKVKVKLDSEQGTDIKEYSVDDIRVVKDAERKYDQDEKINLEELKNLED